MKKCIYYLEDSEADFINFSSRLKGSKLAVFPPLDSWLSEINVVKLYLQNPNEENKKIILDILKNYKIDLFLIDISLFHSNAGGITFYENIVSATPEYDEKFVLFFTYPDTAELVITSSKVRIEYKSEGRGGRIDYNKSAQRVYDKIKELLKIEGGVLDFIDDIY